MRTVFHVKHPLSNRISSDLILFHMKHLASHDCLWYFH
jgi:hypothetical protein